MTNEPAQPSTDALRVEIDRLTADDKPERTKQFALLVRANVRSWRDRHAETLLSSRWELAEAVLARLDATYQDDLGSLFYAQGKSSLTELCQILIRQSDPQWIIRGPRRLALLRRLLPHEALRLWDLRP